MKPISDREFMQIVEYVKNNYGINLFHKKALVVARLQNYLINNNFSSFSEYYDSVLADKTGESLKTFVNRLTVNHTYFMREVEHFNYFKSEVLPSLVSSSQSTKKDIRVWSAGCSSGEEPYTLSMIIDDYFGERKGSWDTKILATDISTKVLEHALAGIYATQDISSLPDKWRKKYFSKLDEEKSIISEKLKNEIIFKKFNLMEDIFPFKQKFHVIFCRNVMIYFDQKTKNELVDKFYNHLEYGGYLFIGQSESLNKENEKLKYVIPSVYRKPLL